MYYFPYFVLIDDSCMLSTLFCIDRPFSRAHQATWHCLWLLLFSGSRTLLQSFFPHLVVASHLSEFVDLEALLSREQKLFQKRQPGKQYSDSLFTPNQLVFGILFWIVALILKYRFWKWLIEIVDWKYFTFRKHRGEFKITCCNEIVYIVRRRIF